MTEHKDIWSVPVSAIFPLVLTYYRQGECQSNKNYTRLYSVLVSYALLNNFQIVHVYTEKDNINLKLEYDKRIQLLAHFKQEKLGPFTPDKDVETGYFDVVGSDRRYLYTVPVRQSQTLMKWVGWNMSIISTGSTVLVIA